MKVFWIFGRFGEALVEVYDKRFQPSIGFFDTAYFIEAHFFDEPVLKWFVGTLNTTFCLRAVRTDKLNTNIVQDSTKLSSRFASGGMIYSKNTVFVAVKCQRLTMFLNIFTGVTTLR